MKSVKKSSLTILALNCGLSATATPKAKVTGFGKTEKGKWTKE
jgi:hypothetical protein